MNIMTTRRSIHSFTMDEKKKVSERSRAPKPLPEPVSIANAFVIFISQVCQKITFVSIWYRLIYYLIMLFVVSTLTDKLPFPKSYFSDTSNIFNVYFVKLGWFWTSLLCLLFLILTSSIYCCGRRNMIAKHTVRWIFSTFVWYFWVNFFNYIEGKYGVCSEKPEIKFKSQCRSAGHTWDTFDLSGHTFILIYSILVLIEEVRPVIGWESIRDSIRNELYSRTHSTNDITPLRDLSNLDFDILQTSYIKFLQHVRLLFIVTTLLIILWDAMLLSTILYFHSMPEKLFAGLVAIFMWFVTYKVLYKVPYFAFYSPGEGLFKYNMPNENKLILKRASISSSQRNNVPSFMGMPLNLSNNGTS